MDVARKVPALIVRRNVAKPVELKRGAVVVCPPMEKAARIVLEEIASGVTTRYRIAQKIERLFLIANPRLPINPDDWKSVSGSVV